jgi:hypothetical protein
MLVKAKVLESINKFPDFFSIDDLIEKLIIIDKIEKANTQSLNNEIVSESELDIEVEKWFK